MRDRLRRGAAASSSPERPTSWWRWLLGTSSRGLGLVLALNCVFLLGLVAVYSIPDEPVVDHLVQSLSDKSYGPDYVPDGVGGTTDRYTECIVATSGVVAPGADINPWRKALLAPRLEHCNSAPFIRAVAAGDPDAHWGAYIRYWNGFAVLTRPSMALVGLMGTRLLMGAFFAVGLIAAWGAVARRTHPLAAAALLLPLLAASNVMQSPMAFSHAVSLGVVMLGVVLATRARSARGAALWAVVAGALFNYVDLLTVPGMSWAFTAAAAGLAAWSCGARAGRVLGWVGAAVVGWAGGYGLSWILRWLISSVEVGFSKVYADIVEVGAFRLGGSHKDEVSTAWGQSTARNVEFWFDTVPTAWTVLWAACAVAVVALVVALLRHRLQGLATALVLALPAALVPLWYELMKNHSQIHRFFVYRSVPAAIGVILLGCVVAALPRRAAVDAGEAGTASETAAARDALHPRPAGSTRVRF